MINIVITMGRAYILISHDLHHCLLSLFCLKHFRGGGRRGGKGEEEEWVRRGGGVGELEEEEWVIGSL